MFLTDSNKYLFKQTTMEGPSAIFRLLLALTLTLTLCQADVNRKTLLISLDGFRWDYISKTSTPNFDKLIAEGTHVKKVKNAFATLTMPNHWTLVTGLYEEDHGIIANSFYAPDLNDTYSFGTDTKWYNNSEPVWITAEKEGKRAGAYMWVGNQAEYEGASLTKVVPFSSGSDFETSLNIVVDWLATDNLTFACVYTDHPDKEGHDYGPNSEQIKTTISKIDGTLGVLMAKLDDLDLTDSVNILIASDHGMTDVYNVQSIDLSRYINFKEEIEWSYASAIGLIRPKPGMTQQVYDKLKAAEASEPHMKVYKKEDVPENLKYKKHSRITDIVIIPDNGWLLKKNRYGISLRGNHGFNNTHSDMMTTFIARGPDFKRGHKQEMMESVDLYPLMCSVLDLKTCHSSRGNLSKVIDFLSDGTKEVTSAKTTESSVGELKSMVWLLLSTVITVFII